LGLRKRIRFGLIEFQGRMSKSKSVDRAPTVSPTLRRIVNASAEIYQNEPERMDFMHAVLCQVGMPRRSMPTRRFERHNGNVHLLLQAGQLWQRGEWREQPLPYGTRPRLVMVHVSSEAIRRETPFVEVGHSMREFLLSLGIDTSGGAKGGYTMFKKQMAALAACRMTIGINAPDHDITINTQPISSFTTWVHDDDSQAVMWPGIMKLSPEFFATLIEYAVPLDHRALGALTHSALAIDIYTWLAHRLCRIRRPEGVELSWANLQDQFGQEYRALQDFKKEFRPALLQVRAVYPDARIEETPGGLLLKPSLPPIRKVQISV
jgi:hypothetical protein